MGSILGHNLFRYASEGGFGAAATLACNSFRRFPGVTAAVRQVAMLPFELSHCSSRLRKHALVGVRGNLQRIYSLYRRSLARIVRATAPPLWVGVAVAAGLIGVEVVLVLWLHRLAPQNAYGALFLLGVLVVSAAWDFGLAVATSGASALMYVFFHEDSLGPALFVFLCLALLANVLAGQARLHAAEAEQRRVEANLVAEFARTTLRAKS